MIQSLVALGEAILPDGVVLDTEHVDGVKRIQLTAIRDLTGIATGWFYATLRQRAAPGGGAAQLPRFRLHTVHAPRRRRTDARLRLQAGAEPAVAAGARSVARSGSSGRNTSCWHRWIIHTSRSSPSSTGDCRGVGTATSTRCPPDSRRRSGSTSDSRRQSCWIVGGTTCELRARAGRGTQTRSRPSPGAGAQLARRSQRSSSSHRESDVDPERIENPADISSRSPCQPHDNPPSTTAMTCCVDDPAVPARRVAARREQQTEHRRRTAGSARLKSKSSVGAQATTGSTDL